ncbi:hypothetical protein [Methylobacterium mesophilicum]
MALQDDLDSGGELAIVEAVGAPAGEDGLDQQRGPGREDLPAERDLGRGAVLLVEGGKPGCYKVEQVEGVDEDVSQADRRKCGDRLPLPPTGARDHPSEMALGTTGQRMQRPPVPPHPDPVRHHPHPAAAVVHSLPSQTIRDWTGARKVGLSVTVVIRTKSGMDDHFTSYQLCDPPRDCVTKPGTPQ